MPAIRARAAVTFSALPRVAGAEDPLRRERVLFIAIVFSGCAPDDPTGAPERTPFEAPVPYSTGGTTPASLHVADVTGDGFLDILIVARTEKRVQILPGNGNGTFGSPRSEAAGSDPLRVATGDVDGDGIRDLLAIGHFDNAFQVRRGIGDGGFGSSATYALRNHGRQLGVADVNGDGFDDVVAAHDGSGQPIYVTVFLGSVSGAMQKAWELGTTHAASKNLVFADFDADGAQDFALGAGDAAAALLLFHGSGTGLFAPPVAYPPQTETPGAADGTERLATADLNGDGRPDLVVVHRNLASMLSIRLGGASGLGSPLFVPLPEPGDVALGDVDRDGSVDAVVSLTEASSIAVLYGVGDGSLHPPLAVPVGSQPEGIALADFDGDGYPDIAVTDLADHRVRVLLNRRMRRD